MNCEPGCGELVKIGTRDKPAEKLFSNQHKSIKIPKRDGSIGKTDVFSPVMANKFTQGISDIGREVRQIARFCMRGAVILTAKFISGASVRWVDCQPEICQRIYFANHTSHLDPIVIWSMLPENVRDKTRLVAAKDYWSAGPIRRALARLFNAVLIDRRHISIKNTPVMILLEEMGNDYSIVIFPEGGRGNGEQINEFKSGIYYMAKKRPEIELVPVYLDNMNRILPRGMVLPVPMLSRVVFGPPIWIERGERKEAFLQRCREAVLKLKDC